MYWTHIVWLLDLDVWRLLDAVVVVCLLFIHIFYIILFIHITWRSCGRTCCSCPRRAGRQCRWSRQRRSAWPSRSNIRTCKVLTWEYVPSYHLIFLQYRKISQIMFMYGSEIFTNLVWCREEGPGLPLQVWSPLNWCWYQREFYSWPTCSIYCTRFAHLTIIKSNYQLIHLNSSVIMTK